MAVRSYRAACERLRMRRGAGRCSGAEWTGDYTAAGGPGERWGVPTEAPWEAKRKAMQEGGSNTTREWQRRGKMANDGGSNIGG